FSSHHFRPVFFAGFFRPLLTPRTQPKNTPQKTAPIDPSRTQSRRSAPPRCRSGQTRPSWITSARRGSGSSGRRRRRGSTATHSSGPSRDGLGYGRCRVRPSSPGSASPTASHPQPTSASSYLLGAVVLDRLMTRGMLLAQLQKAIQSAAKCSPLLMIDC
uniref:Uncharacterized protein n=13 Tax=Aegilops tauschii subsp. strangulata TaxID=200361 RepID=A0A453M2B4_AEGTS